MPLFVETVAPEWTDVGICLVVTLAVDTFEKVEAWFALFGFEIERIDLEVGLAIPDKVVIIFNLVRLITLKILGILYIICKGGMPPLPVVLAL